MKTKTPLTLIIGLTFFLTFKSKGQTTEEEYNYITKGYEIQIATGLDMKKGYSFKELGSWGLNNAPINRNVTFKGLYKGAETKPCAIMMVYKRIDPNKPEENSTSYYCIPHHKSSEDIWQKTLNDINLRISDANSIDLARTWTYALMKLASEQTSK